MFRRILVATDLTESSKSALLAGLELGRRLGAKVDVVHVTESPITARPWYLPYTEGEGAFLRDIGAKMREAARHVLEDQVKEATPDPREDDTQVLVKEGIPSDVIVSLAKDTGADLIVMGTHGRTGMRHLVLGSIAERVVRTAHCPVLTVRAKGGHS